MKISTEELRRATDSLLRHWEECEQTEFEIAEDYYWDVPAEARYAPYETPARLSIGQLTDDWSEVTQMVNGDREPLAYGLVWLAAVLRRVGERALG